MLYKVRIEDSNKVLVVKGKPVRSPFEAVVREKEIKSLKSQIKIHGVLSYTIEEIYSGPIISSSNISKNERVLPPLKDEINVNPSFDEIKEVIFISSPKKKNKESEKIEINNLNIEKEKEIELDDTEIKIEELSLHSESILRKYMNME